MDNETVGMRAVQFRWRQFGGLSVVLIVLATTLAFPTAQAEDDFLDPEVAFKGSVRAFDDKTVEVSFDIAPGYYLYREQFKFAANGATLGAPTIPPGKVKFDETFQKNVETYRGMMRILVPVQQAGGQFRVAVNYQGCADKGLCYPPAQMRADVNLTGFGGNGTVRVLAGREMPISGAVPDTAPARLSATQPATPSVATSLAIPTAALATAPNVAVNVASAADDIGTEAALRAGGFWTVIGAFFLAGVALSLTPCVLPMVPILSSIIVGQSSASGAHRGRSFALSVSYSLGVALVYTALGVAAGVAGEGLAATLQNPWVLSAFALMLVGLSLSMFGVYELQLPSSFASPLTHTSRKLPAGQFAGVFAMGGLSALIVSPCVAAPLAAALVFISRTRDVVLGGGGLFALSVGMSVPLLLVGASAGALLPRAGAWMNDVKHVFGVLLIAVALWIVQPVLSAALALGLWGALLVGSAIALLEGETAEAPSFGKWARKAGAAMLAIFGTIQIVGATSGGTDPIHPLSHFTTGRDSAAPTPLAFAPVRSGTEFDAALVAATKAGKPVMLDFYADWCVSCKEMERFTFSEAPVRAKLANAVLLKADVTKNSADDRELLKRFQLFGPPGTIFFDAQGKELAQQRVIGFQNTERFLETLRGVGL